MMACDIDFFEGVQEASREGFISVIALE